MNIKPPSYGHSDLLLWMLVAAALLPSVLSSSDESASSFSPARRRHQDGGDYGGLLGYEWEKYGCGNSNESDAPPTAGCFCDFLNDRIDFLNDRIVHSLDPPSAFSFGVQQSGFQCLEGMAGPGGIYPCKNVDLESFVPLFTFFLGFGRGCGGEEDDYTSNDLWGWTDNKSGREFVLIGLVDGTGFVEITDPQNPIYIGKLPTHTANSFWRDIKTYDHYAYIVSEADFHGMQIFDLKQLLTTRSCEDDQPITFESSGHYDGVGAAHNLFINEESGYAYIMGYRGACNGGGLIMLHVADDPTNPTLVGCFGDDGYVHDAHCVLYRGPHTEYVGKEICFCCNEDTITIVDVTNKAQPIQLSRISYDNYAFTHQGWLSTNHEYFVFGDESDERDFGLNTKTLLMNVQDLTNPQLAGFYESQTRSVDHNLYITTTATNTPDSNTDSVDIIYQANYRAGLRVLRVNDYGAANFEEVAFFDVYPGSDEPRINGAWSVFPYFPSGNIVVSGVEQGLFVLRCKQC